MRPAMATVALAAAGCSAELPPLPALPPAVTTNVDLRDLFTDAVRALGLFWMSLNRAPSRPP